MMEDGSGSFGAGGGGGGGDDDGLGGDMSRPTFVKILLPPPPRAVELAHAEEPSKKLYWDRSHYDSPASQKMALRSSSTLYVGNLAFSTATRQIRAHFSQLGPVKSVQQVLPPG